MPMSAQRSVQRLWQDLVVCDQHDFEAWATAIWSPLSRRRHFDELMLPGVIDKLANKNSGFIIIIIIIIIIITTPTDLIDLINATRRCKIIAIKDAVVFEHGHRKSIITPIEVGTDTRSLAACLWHLLRLAPDVVCVGEMRDLDTIATARAAAETGHLVIATGRELGIHSLEESLASLYQQVLSSLNHTLANAVRPDKLRMLLCA
jgi:Tfp pilus assembly pilus retraction ATPase PilT